MKRRALLRGGLQGALTLGVAKTLHNTVVGYGHFGIGHNLRTRELEPVARASMPRLDWRERTIDGVPVRVRDGVVRYRQAGAWTAVTEEAPLHFRDLQQDVADLRADAVRFRFLPVDAFFDLTRRDESRPSMVALLRRERAASPTDVASVTGVSPADSAALIAALVGAFRDRTSYDIPRYLAGSVEDNLLPGDADLRAPFVPEVDFARLARGDKQFRLFCTGYTRLANEAIHATPVSDQQPPIFGVQVRNRRHKHVYNGIGSVLRLDGDLTVPMAFVDYMETTLVDDFRANRLRELSVDAAAGRHRADEIRW